MRSDKGYRHKRKHAGERGSYVYVCGSSHIYDIVRTGRWHEKTSGLHISGYVEGW